MYIGAKYLGKQTVKLGRTGSLLVKQGDLIRNFPEREAIGRPEFEPVYDKPKKETNKKSKDFNEFKED